MFMQKIFTYKEKLVHKLNSVKDMSTYNKVMAEKLSQNVKFPEKLYTVALNPASLLPHLTLEYYCRAVSILKKLIQNPGGIKKLRNYYSRIKRGTVAPPKKVLASRYPLKVMVGALVQAGYLGLMKKGYYTTSKGKQLLQSVL